ncbi:spore protease YyaC [Litchfieldia salsa]|uniref:Putative sporulation protein YyaC n=1 Tax=Litchfieldia salsa TaxID=930152 RepID=A0A1H0UED4_9BACI|nr:spore protease YyaC [Litchfieldia salsa]SDP64597.1 putative sporulation protein YyaC [Litchfieldia salsa]
MNLKQNLLDTIQGENNTRISYESEEADKEIARKVSSMLPSNNQPVIIICIGTDRSTGDSLGPLIGTKLSEKRLSQFHVYGTLDDPIHAVNLEDKMNLIKQTYRDPFIIGIDACLGRLKSVGIISIADGPVKPGAGVNKSLTPVGNMHITGIVNVSGFMEFFVLQNTRLSLVMKMADVIVDSLLYADLLRSRKQDLLQSERQKILQPKKTI